MKALTTLTCSLVAAGSIAGFAGFAVAVVVAVVVADK